MTGRFGTESRKGWCHIHGTFYGITCGMCNPTNKEQAYAMYVFASYVVALFDTPTIGRETLDSIFESCIKSDQAQNYLRLYSDDVERHLARARLTQVVKNNINIWIDGKTYKEPI